MECLRTPYVVPWHPWPGRCPSAQTPARPRGHMCASERTLVCPRRCTRIYADASVLSQVTSKRMLQCVQVMDAPAAIVRPSVRPSVCYRPRDNPASRPQFGEMFHIDVHLASGIGRWRCVLILPSRLYDTIEILDCIPVEFLGPILRGG
jgi:hypothetical protein